MSEILTEAASWIRDAGQPLWGLEQVAVERVAADCDAGSFFLAWVEERAVGTMRLTDWDPDFWPEAQRGEAVYLHRLAVRRAAAGGRVSTALLHHAILVAKERAARFVRLDVLSERSALRQVYERFGFALHSYHSVYGAHVARYEFDVRNPGNLDG